MTFSSLIQEGRVPGPLDGERTTSLLWQKELQKLQNPHLHCFPHLLRKVVTQFCKQILRRNFQLAKSAQHISGPDTFINNKENLLVRMVV